MLWVILFSFSILWGTYILDRVMSLYSIGVGVCGVLGGMDYSF